MLNIKRSKEIKRSRRFMDSKIMESSIIGISGLIAISICGIILFGIGLIFSLSYLTIPFTDELLLLADFPMFFVFATVIKVLIGGKLIELSVRYISRLLGIKRIIIDPDKPLTVIR